MVEYGWIITYFGEMSWRLVNIDKHQDSDEQERKIEFDIYCVIR